MFDGGSSPPWLQELNAEQRTAVEHAGGPLLILAGAGTGKTTTLCSRVAWLLSKGIPAERILLLSFTRRARDGSWAAPSTRLLTGSYACTPPRSASPRASA